MQTIENYLDRPVAKPLFAALSEPDLCESGTFGENIYATKPAKIRKIIIGVQGDFFWAFPLFFGTDSLLFIEIGFAEPLVLVLIVAVFIISPLILSKKYLLITYV